MSLILFFGLEYYLHCNLERFCTENVCATRGAGVAFGLLTIMETIGFTKPCLSCILMNVQLKDLMKYVLQQVLYGVYSVNNSEFTTNSQNIYKMYVRRLVRNMPRLHKSTFS